MTDAPDVDPQPQLAGLGLSHDHFEEGERPWSLAGGSAPRLQRQRRISDGVVLLIALAGLLVAGASVALLVIYHPH